MAKPQSDSDVLGTVRGAQGEKLLVWEEPDRPLTDAERKRLATLANAIDEKGLPLKPSE